MRWQNFIYNHFLNKVGSVRVKNSLKKSFKKYEESKKNFSVCLVKKI